MAQSSPKKAAAFHKKILQAIHETVPPSRPMVGYVPKLLTPPVGELTKGICMGVDCDEVFPSIFIGDEGSARNKDFLSAVGITHVFNTAEGSGFGLVSTYAQYYTDTPITYFGLKLMDLPTTRIINYFDQGTHFIHSAISSGGKVLVHCLMGISRSTTFVIAYLMMQENITAEKAIRTIRSRRDIRPNDGFLMQLFQLETSLNLPQ